MADASMVAYRPSADVAALVIHDRSDKEIPFEDFTELRERWSGLERARFVATEGLGHRRILLDEAVVERVVAFIENGLWQ